MNNTEDKPSLMSATLQSFLWQRIIEILGLVTCVVSLCLLLALVTANDNDPSFNTASAQDVENWLGLWGANLANFLFSAVGISAVGFAVAPFIWGTRLLFNKHLSKWRLRIPTLIFSIVLLSMASYGLFNSADPDRLGGLSGRLGVVLFSPLVANLALPGGLSAQQLIGGVAAGLGIVTFIWSSALSKHHWVGIAAVPRLLRVISQPLLARLRQRAAAKKEARRLDQNIKAKKPSKKLTNKTRQEPVLMQPGQPDAIGDKTPATSAKTAKKIQASFDFESNNPL